MRQMILTEEQLRSKRKKAFECLLEKHRSGAFLTPAEEADLIFCGLCVFGNYSSLKQAFRKKT